MRVVLDTNVFISGIFWEGNFCSQIIGEWRKGKFQLVNSPKLIEEFLETLGSFKISMPKEMIQEWKNIIIENSVIVNPIITINAVKDDPEDNKLVEAAVCGRADFIITQDKHLLKLKEYNKIKILKPEEAILVL